MVLLYAMIFDSLCRVHLLLQLMQLQIVHGCESMFGTKLATLSADILNRSSLERHSSVEENGIGCTDRQEKDGFCLMCLADCKDCVNVRGTLQEKKKVH